MSGIFDRADRRTGPKTHFRTGKQPTSNEQKLAMGAKADTIIRLTDSMI